jgi:8-oxo-dGTP diphosphatase
LASLFADRSIDLLWSSPATRCLQTLGPLAQSKGLQIVEHPNLAEGADTRATLADLDELIGRDGTVVACSHGDIIPPVIDQLAHRGVEIRGRECEVGSLWALEPADGQTWRQARYIPPEAPRLA